MELGAATIPRRKPGSRHGQIGYAPKAQPNWVPLESRDRLCYATVLCLKVRFEYALSLPFFLLLVAS